MQSPLFDGTNDHSLKMMASLDILTLYAHIYVGANLTNGPIQILPK